MVTGINRQRQRMGALCCLLTLVGGVPSQDIYIQISLEQWSGRLNYVDLKEEVKNRISMRLIFCLKSNAPYAQKTLSLISP